MTTLLKTLKIKTKKLTNRDGKNREKMQKIPNLSATEIISIENNEKVNKQTKFLLKFKVFV